jgi:hypothetical protein
MPATPEGTGPAESAQAWFRQPVQGTTRIGAPFAVYQPAAARHIRDAMLTRVVGIMPGAAGLTDCG